MILLVMYRAKSGNKATIKITELGTKAVCSVGWRDCPPSEEDMAGANAAANSAFAMANNIPVSAIQESTSQYFEDKDESSKATRAFLGGGLG